MDLKIDYKADMLDFIKNKLHIIATPEVKEQSARITAFFELVNDKQYGVVFSKLDKNKNIELLDDNQFVTEQGSSIVYTSVEKPYYIITLMADYLNEKYSLNVSVNKEKSNE